MRVRITTWGSKRGGSIARLVLHAVAGWAVCATLMGDLLAMTSTDIAVGVHAIAAPLIFAFVARHYFHAPGARRPLPTALAFAIIVALLDLVIVAGAIQHSLLMFHSTLGTWIPLASIVIVTWIVGKLIVTIRHPHAAGA